MPAVSAAIAKLEIVFNEANAIRMKYSAIESEGDQLQIERERVRMTWASELSLKRYRNMMYQIMRNDDLQRYNEAFESAASNVLAHVPANLRATYKFAQNKVKDLKNQRDGGVIDGEEYVRRLALIKMAFVRQCEKRKTSVEDANNLFADLVTR